MRDSIASIGAEPPQCVSRATPSQEMLQFSHEVIDSQCAATPPALWSSQQRARWPDGLCQPSQVCLALSLRQNNRSELAAQRQLAHPFAVFGVPRCVAFVHSHQQTRVYGAG